MNGAEGSTYLIGIAGGSGSGKTTFARALAARLPREHCALLFQDSYYIDQSARFDHDGGAVNFDHPDALDFPLLAAHLRELKAGRGIHVPLYDFATHTRLQTTVPQPARRIVLVDGILILTKRKLRDLMDIKVYVDTDADVRFIRRLQRDMHERGRSLDSIIRQYYDTVRPMHHEFLEPTRQYADLIVGEETDVAADVLAARVSRALTGTR
jgi:uridine kinase